MHGLPRMLSACRESTPQETADLPTQSYYAAMLHGESNTSQASPRMTIQRMPQYHGQEAKSPGPDKEYHDTGHEYGMVQ